MIIKCTCENAFMDKMYGRGRRVGNPTERKGGDSSHRCASCGREVLTGARDNAGRR